MQVEATISDNKTSLFSNFCTNVQNTANASFRSIKQNETVQKTAAAVKEYAPYVIGFVGSYFAPVAVTVGCLTATFVIAIQRPQYISHQTFGKLVIGVSGSMLVTAIKMGISLKSTCLSFASGVTFSVGKTIRDLDAKPKQKQFYLYG